MLGKRAVNVKPLSAWQAFMQLLSISLIKALMQLDQVPFHSAVPRLCATQQLLFKNMPTRSENKKVQINQKHS